MERPSRKTKVVNYSLDQDFHDDDEDFASMKAPPSKKARESVKDHERMKTKKPSSKSASQESDSQSLGGIQRVSVDDKLYNRDLEAALTLSLLQTAELKKEHGSTHQEVMNQPQRECEQIDPALRLTNCSVDINLLGLDQITSEQGSLCSPHIQRKAASKAMEQQKAILKDEDYQPKETTDSESDDDFSDQAESEDEEFTVKKAKKTNKKDKITKKEKTKQPQVSKKEKQAITKPSKARPHSTASPKVVRSPTVEVKPALVERHPSTPTVSRSLSVSVSPAGGRVPKWNPPAQIGRSPGTSQSTAIKSPGQGLRLGLSRRVRVKPLHPSVAIH